MGEEVICCKKKVLPGNSFYSSRERFLFWKCGRCGRVLKSGLFSVKDLDSIKVSSKKKVLKNE